MTNNAKTGSRALASSRSMTTLEDQITPALWKRQVIPSLASW